MIKNESDMLIINRSHIRTLQLHSAGVREILQRYYISLSVLLEQPNISRGYLEKRVVQLLSVYQSCMVLMRRSFLIRRFSLPLHQV